MEIVSITDRAIKQLSCLLNNKQDTIGIRVCIKPGGCSGQKYYLEYADQIRQFDQIVVKDNIQLIIDQKALLYIMGSEIDYSEDKFASGFIFKNPNEKGRCGCGKSFSV